jgi:hypothetical protein
MSTSAGPSWDQVRAALADEVAMWRNALADLELGRSSEGAVFAGLGSWEPPVELGPPPAHLSGELHALLGELQAVERAARTVLSRLRVELVAGRPAPPSTAVRRSALDLAL